MALALLAVASLTTARSLLACLVGLRACEASLPFLALALARRPTKGLVRLRRASARARLRALARRGSKGLSRGAEAEAEAPAPLGPLGPNQATLGPNPLDPALGSAPSPSLSARLRGLWRFASALCNGSLRNLAHADQAPQALDEAEAKEKAKAAAALTIPSRRGVGRKVRSPLSP